jgi:hypothetical protein
MASKQILPVEIVSKSDMVRLKHELTDLDEVLHQSGLRKGGEATSLPKIHPLVEEFASATGSNLLHKEDRLKLLKLVDSIMASAPVIHISFATTPSPAFLNKLVKWFRTEINATTLLQIGLQPSIAAGCIVRTPNKQFDLSLRKFLINKQSLLANAVRGEG